MTVFESTLKLFDWFSSNDSFVLEEDFLKLILISNDEERDKASVLLALDSLKEAGMIKEILIQENKVWVLERSLEKLSQKLEVDHSIALEMAKVLNDAAEKYNVKNSVCDPQNLTSDNLKDLIVLAGVTTKVDELDEED